MRRTDAALLIVLAAVWGAAYPLTTVVLRDVTPQGVVFWRTATAAAVLIPFASRGRAWAAVRKHWRAVVVAAVVQAAIPLVLLTAGQPHVSSSVAGIISGAQPVIVMLFALAVRVQWSG